MKIKVGKGTWDMSGLLDKVRRAGQYRILNHKPPFLITCGYPKCLYIDENGPMMTIYGLFALIVALRKSCHRCQPSPTVANDCHQHNHHRSHHQCHDRSHQQNHHRSHQHHHHRSHMIMSSLSWLCFITVMIMCPYYPH